MLYALFGILALAAAFAYGRGRFKAGYNKARLEQKEAESKESERMDKIINANSALGRDELLKRLRGSEKDGK